MIPATEHLGQIIQRLACENAKLRGENIKLEATLRQYTVQPIYNAAVRRTVFERATSGTL